MELDSSLLSPWPRELAQKFGAAVELLEAAARAQGTDIPVAEQQRRALLAATAVQEAMAAAPPAAAQRSSSGGGWQWSKIEQLGLLLQSTA